MIPEKFDASYLELISDKRIFDSTLSESASIISRHCAVALSSSRASVWISHEDQSVLHCLTLYRAETGSYDNGAILEEASFPQYYQALSTSRVIDASNTFEDNRTVELKETHTKMSAR